MQYSPRDLIRRVKVRVGWRLWPALLVALAILNYLARQSFPAFPYYYEGNVFYPLMVIYNQPLFHVIILVLASISLVKLFLSVKRNRTRLNVILAGIALIWASTLCIASTSDI